jgi:VanZ family protein
VYLQYRNKRNLWIIVLIFYMLFLLAVSVKPAKAQPQVSWIKETLHNLCHVPAYSILLFAIAAFLRAYKVKSRILVKAFIITVLYGVLMEFLQASVPGRTPSVSDMFLNAGGALIMIALIQKGFIKKWLVSPGKSRAGNSHS